MKGGDYRPDPDADRFPKLEMGKKGSKNKFALLHVFDDYTEKNQLSPATIKRWRLMIKQVAAAVPDMRDLTRDDVKITDVRISANHAWRHRFKTLARRAGMDFGARDYMQGHAPATDGGDYGELKPVVLLREISKFSVIDIGLKSSRTCETRR